LITRTDTSHPRSINQYHPKGEDDPIGDGPELAAFRAAVSIALDTDNSGFWRSRGDFKHPAPVRYLDNQSKTTYKAFGTLFLLYFLVTGTAPANLSPFLFYLLLASAQEVSTDIPIVIDATCMNFSLGFIASVDPDAAETLQPWMALKNTDPVNGAGIRSDLVRTLATIGVQVSVYPNYCS
jgi:hypothetical protein